MSGVFVVGGGHSHYLGRAHPDFVARRDPDVSGRENPGLLEHLAEALDALRQATGADLGAVERVVVANFLGECFLRQGHLGALLPEVAPELSGKPIARIEAACASGGVAVSACVDALRGAADVVLAVGVEIETTVRGSEGVDFMNRAAWTARQAHLDRFLFPHLFARRARAYKERFGATEEDPQAGCTPAEIHVAEVHDCFSIAELQGVDALGLGGEPGGALRRLRDGDTALDGRLPVNPGGGLLGFGHPVGATGVKQVVEIWRQLTGRAGAYEVAGAPSLGVSGNVGGDDRTGVVVVQRA